jgi:phosphopentomutase
MPPTSETLLDTLTSHGHPVTAIGKIKDLFAGRGITEAFSTTSDDHGMDILAQRLAVQDTGLLFVNLVDFDTLYGHRNDVTGYGRNLERFDGRLAGLLAALRADDVVVITADHGNDPATPSTDHSREHLPLLVAGTRVRAGVSLGTRDTFADLAQTLAELFRVPRLAHGRSFLKEIV